MQKTISITSDWNQGDYYLATLKARLQQLLPQYQLMDISHQINCFDSMQAAFILKSTWYLFPKGSIHLNCVNSAASINTPHVLIVHKGHYFIGTDTGYWSFICGEKPEKAYLINNESDYEQNSFPEFSVFAPLAAAIGNGISKKELGEANYTLKEALELQPVTQKNITTAGIIYFDSYGNAITNLKKAKFLDIIDSSRFIISLVSEHNQMKKIAKSYLDARPGEIISIFNSQNLLEIAIREGNIKQLLNLNIGDQIRIEVIEK